jgi:hypothetical protein
MSEFNSLVPYYNWRKGVRVMGQLPFSSGAQNKSGIIKSKESIFFEYTENRSIINFSNIHKCVLMQVTYNYASNARKNRQSAT